MNGRSDPSDREMVRALQTAFKEIRNANFPSLISGLRILVIEDTADLRLLYSRLLKRAGAIASFANSAEEAWSALSESVPDLLICDIGLPDEDGMTFVKRLRAHDSGQLRYTPAIALTAFTDLKKEILLSGFDGFLSKPVTGIELISMVSAVWTQKHNRQH